MITEYKPRVINRRLTCAYGAATLTNENSGSNMYPMPTK
jgi:hypothetical protein